MMTIEEAKERYRKRFGGFPEFLFMGSSDEEVVKAVEEALRTGKEIEPSVEDGDY